MEKINNLVLTSVILFIVLTTVCPAETFHLNENNQWQNSESTEQSRFLLSMSKVKQQLISGNSKDAVAALEQLRQDFPNIDGEQLDAYLEAERFYAKERWYKAATKYTQFAKAFPDSPLQPAALERIYSVATAYLQGEKRRFFKVLKLPAFDTGAKLMQDIADRAGTAPIAWRALTTLAEKQEKKGKYLDAYKTWSQVADRWPTGEAGQQALLRMGQALHVSYDGIEYDASVLESAKTYFEDFVNRYPEKAVELGIQDYLNTINEQLAYKTYQMGFYYERTGSLEAAELYYNKVLEEWPDSDAAKMAMARSAPNPAPAVRTTVRRKAFNKMNGFLDSWFGMQPLIDKSAKENSLENKG